MAGILLFTALPITGLLGVSFRNVGGPEKCGQDLKIIGLIICVTIREEFFSKSFILAFEAFEFTAGQKI